MILSRWTLDQLLRWIGTTALIVMFVPMGLYLTGKVSSSVEQILTERGQGLGKTLAVQIVDPLLLEDRLALHDAIHKAASTDSVIRYLCIEDSKGQIVAHTFDEGFPAELCDLWDNNRDSIIHFRAQNEPFLDISAPILAGRLGILHIGMSRAQAIKAASELLWLMGIILGVVILIILVGSHMLATKVSKPLQQLEAEVLRFSEQPYRQIVTEETGIREIDSLSKCFTEMVRSLHLLEEERLATQQRMIHTERLAALGELAAGLAHEVHNPLDGMLECLRYLENDPQKSERAMKYHPMVKEGLERIARVMQQTLIFARSGQNVSVEACRVAEMLSSLEMLVQSQMNGRNMQLTWADAGSNVCWCNKSVLEQAGLNLILNAAEAAEENIDPKVKIEVSSDSENVYISVEDSGRGVPKELHKRIFEPFFTTKPIGKGTGLGLSVSRQLIRAVGGELELSAQSGSLGGARFVIRFPKV